MDIGGGSIEFLIANQNTVFWKQSFEIGGQRLVDKFHRNDPIKSEEIEELEQYLNTQLAELWEQTSIHDPGCLVGSSGTFDTLSEIYQFKNGAQINKEATEFPFDFQYLEGISQEIINKSKDERLRIPGMIELRVDMIVVAVILIRYILKTTRIKDIRVSAYALKEGVLLKTIDKLLKDQSIKTDI